MVSMGRTIELHKLYSGHGKLGSATHNVVCCELNAVNDKYVISRQ